ncbi:hypothetical protein C5167_050951, partial [Papaver somniferum]
FQLASFLQPASSQLNPIVYSTKQGGRGFGSAVQPLALISEDMDPTSTQILSTSSSHIGAYDVGVIVEVPEIILRPVTLDEVLWLWPARIQYALDKAYDAGRNTTASGFVISLLQALVTQESGVGVSELHNLIEALAKLATALGSPESLPQLVEVSRDVSLNAPALSGYMVSNSEKANQSRDRMAPSVRLSICEATGTDDAAVTSFFVTVVVKWPAQR